MNKQEFEDFKQRLTGHPRNYVDKICKSLQEQYTLTKEKEVSLYLEEIGIPFSEALIRLSWFEQNGYCTLVDKFFGNVFTIRVGSDNLPAITINVERFY